MIILRQKRYSDRFTKFLYGFEKAKDRATTGFKKLVSKDTWKRQPKPHGSPADRLIQAGRLKRVSKPRITGKSDIALKRKAIITRNKIEDSAAKTVLGAKSWIDTIKYGKPEDLTSKIGREVSHRPIQSAATVATFPITGTAIEEGMRKVKPYRKVTDATGEFYDKHLDKIVRKGTTAAYNIAKAIPQ